MCQLVLCQLIFLNFGQDQSERLTCGSIYDNIVARVMMMRLLLLQNLRSQRNLMQPRLLAEKLANQIQLLLIVQRKWVVRQAVWL